MITSRKHYDVDGQYKGFPFAIDEIANEYNSGNFAAAAFLMWGHPGFNPFDTTKHYILTGCVDDGVSSVSEGWVMMGGLIAKVNQTSYTSQPWLTLTKVNPESILWSDGQSRDSVFEYVAVVADWAQNNTGQVALGDFERLTAETNMTLAANWTELILPYDRLGIKIRLFRGFIEISGTVVWSGSTISAANQKICDLPSWAIPPNGWGGVTTSINGGLSPTFSMKVTTSGELQVSGELASGATVVLDNIRWSVLNQ